MRYLNRNLIFSFLFTAILTTLNSCSSGSGEIIYPDGSKYNGHYVKNEEGEKIKNGEGTLTYSDGKKYVGVWEKNVLINGKFYAPNGELIYQGEWKDEKYNGKGQLFPRQGELAGYKLNGQFLNGEANGFGILFNPDSTKEYEGYWKDFQYDGNGTLYINGKKTYEGGWRNGQMEGNGIVFTPDGQVDSEGEFKSSKMNGFGKKYKNGKLYYEGGFTNNIPNGTGTMYYENGNKEYEGMFKNGNPNGKGTSYKENGEKEYEGQFVNGEYKPQRRESATSYESNINEESSHSTLLDHYYGTPNSSQKVNKYCFNDRYNSGNIFELTLIDGGDAKIIIKNSGGRTIRTGEGTWEGRNDGPGGNAPQVILYLTTGTLRFTAIVGGYPSSITMLIDSKDNQWTKCL